MKITYIDDSRDASTPRRVPVVLYRNKRSISYKKRKYAKDGRILHRRDLTSKFKKENSRVDKKAHLSKALNNSSVSGIRVVLKWTVLTRNLTINSAGSRIRQVWFKCRSKTSLLSLISSIILVYVSLNFSNTKRWGQKKFLFMRNHSRDLWKRLKLFSG